MALNENALATFANAKAMFGYDDTEQSAVENLINVASAKIELFTRRLLAARDTTLFLDGNGRQTLIVPEWPINSVISLHVDENRVFAADSLVDPSEYYVDSESGRITLYSDVFMSEGMIRVVKLVAELGYDTGHLHYPVLNAACLEYVDWLKSRYASPGQIGKKGEYSADRVSVSYETDIPLHVRTALGDFERKHA
jgi:hypothetical protein